MKPIDELTAKLAELKKKKAWLDERIVNTANEIYALEQNALLINGSKWLARRLAKKHGIEILDEEKDHARFSVWPPESLQGDKDPHDCDHYVYSWIEVRDRVLSYVKELTK